MLASSESVEKRVSLHFEPGQAHNEHGNDGHAISSGKKLC
jgi:hypothetical protein